MKKKILAWVCVFFLSSGFIPSRVQAAEQTMRGVWISTVYSADYPSVKNDAEKQKQEFITKIDEVKKLGLNTVVVQVRPKADAFYSSNINPWSEILTGTQGKNPGYDPMEFMIAQAHQRNLEFHAWLNPYRITTKGTDLNALAPNHPARLHPEWVLSYKDALYYNPALPQVREHIANTVAEIVRNYDVDAIHFDDYFYPSDYPLSEGQTREGAEATQRRQDVNEMIHLVHDTIEQIKPNVEFGVSPVGIWKNNDSDPSGSATKGYEGYFSVYGDSRTWIQKGWVDYIVPQIYWETGNKAADYETLVKWWKKEVQGTNVKLYIGQGIYKDVVAGEITKQLMINEENQADGSIFFSLRDLLSNRAGCATAVQSYYKAKDSANNNSQKPPVKPAQPDNKESITALATTANILINGAKLPFEAYNINDNNYFKLRDIAMALSETEKQFEVSWDEGKNQIHIYRNAPYTAMGGELGPGDGKNKIAVLSSQGIDMDGYQIQMKAYNINGNNFFRLRDIATFLNFGVTWDENTQTVAIDTSTDYVEP